LPDALANDIELIVGSGKYSALSLSRSLLAVRDKPVLLVVDSGTDDDLAVQERREFLEEALQATAPRSRFRVFFVGPRNRIAAVGGPLIRELEEFLSETVPG
jgi:hypothetical protein